MRTFHPRNALSGTQYGSVTTYYKSTGTYELLPRSAFKKYIALTEEDYEIIETLSQNVSGQDQEEFNTKFTVWKNTWTNPEIVVHSNPRKYAESKEYLELLAYCRNKGSFIPLIIEKLDDDDFYVINLIEDLTYKDNKKLMREVKDENIKNGIAGSLKDNWMNFSKKLLEQMQNYPEEKIGKTSSLPNDFTLLNNYPNPFNPATQIRFGIPFQCRVSLKIYDILGNEIIVLVDNELKQEGWHTVTWDGKNKSGNSVTSGIYIGKLKTGIQIQSIKLLLIK